MKTLGTVVLLCVAALAALWVGGLVIGFIGTVLHWAVILAIFGGIVYVGYSLSNPQKSLSWRRKILP